MTASSPYVFQRLEARSYQHAVSDRRKPTRYLVRLGTLILGTVESQSEESWRSMPSGIRYGFRGFARSWVATDLDHRTVGYRYYSRERAAQALQEHRENPPT